MTLSRDTLTRTTPSQTATHLRGPSFRDTIDATSIHPQTQRTKLGGCTSQNKSPLSSFPNKNLFDSDNSRQRHSCFFIPSSLRGGRLRLVHPRSPNCVAIIHDVILSAAGIQRSRQQRNAFPNSRHVDYISRCNILGIYEWRNGFFSRVCT